MILEASDVTRLLREGLDIDQLESLHRKHRYAFGEPWDVQLGDFRVGGRMPVFEDVQAKFLQPGANRRILTTAKMMVSRMLANTPMPEFVGLESEIIAMTLKGVWRKWLEQGNIYGETDWKAEIDSWLVEGYSTGYSLIMCLPEDVGDFQRTSVHHVPVTQVLFDRHVRNPLNARWLAASVFMGVEAAKAKFLPKKKGERYERILRMIESKVLKWRQSYDSEMVECVRVFYYFDKGIGKAEPTMAIVIGDLDDEPLTVKTNEFECIPGSWFTYMTVPSGRYPIGAVDVQMATQEMRAEIDLYLRDHMRIPTMDVVDTSAVDPKDMIAYYRRNRHAHLVKSSKDVPGHLQRNGPPPLDPSVMVMAERMDRQSAEESDFSDLERGNQLPSDRTKYEAEQIQIASQRNNSWTAYQISLALARLVRLAFKVAGKFDTEPRMVDVGDANVLINDPSNPNSYLSEFVNAEPLDGIVMDEDSMTVRDDRARRAARIAELMSLKELVGLTIDPEWYTRERLKAIGEKVPDDALMQPQQQGAPPVSTAPAVA